MIKNKFSRRSFLKGLLALSVAAAIPAELVEAAKIIYSDDTPLEQSSAALWINEQIIPIVGSAVDVSIPARQKVIRNPFATPFLGEKFQYAYTAPELSTVVVSVDTLYDKFFRSLHQIFDFKIKYAGLPYKIEGVGEKQILEYVGNRLDFAFLADFQKHRYQDDLDSLPSDCRFNLRVMNRDCGTKMRGNR